MSFDKFFVKLRVLNDAQRTYAIRDFHFRLPIQVSKLRQLTSFDKFFVKLCGMNCAQHTVRGTTTFCTSGLKKTTLQFFCQTARDKLCAVRRLSALPV